LWGYIRIYDKNGDVIRVMGLVVPTPALRVAKLIDAVESRDGDKAPATEINCTVNGAQADVDERGVFFKDYSIAGGRLTMRDTTKMKLVARSEKYKEVEVTVKYSIPPPEIYVWRTEVYGR